ncbi:MAG TPA: two-component system regulatory protein YycI [Bacilli bacterium]
MDWGKAKSILIISFLFLNALLGYQLWASKIDIDKSIQGEAETTESIMKLMDSKKITIAAPIPTEVPRLRKITVQFDKTTDPDEKLKLAVVIPISVLNTRTGLKDVVAKQIPKAGSYEMDPTTHKRGIMVLNQLYGGLPMFEVNLKLYHKDSKINDYWQSHVSVQQGPEDSDQKVISAWTALGRLIEKLEPGTEIKEIRLGYHGQIYNSETQVLIPSWRVATSKGKIYFVHAINGELF